MGWREKGAPDDGWGYYVQYLGVVTWYCYRGRYSGRKRPWRSCYRYPKTMREIRAWDPEYGRAKRSPTHLPTHRDEPMRGHQRSWKKHRRHQYKVIAKEGDDVVMAGQSVGPVLRSEAGPRSVALAEADSGSHAGANTAGASESSVAAA